MRYTSGNGKMGKNTDRVFRYGLMDRFMRGAGSMGRRLATAGLSMTAENCILGSGSIINATVMANTFPEIHSRPRALKPPTQR